MGKGAEVADLTNKAMDGSMNLADALEERLKIINCTPADIKAFVEAHPPESRLAPGIKELVSALQARKIAVYIISGGFRELTLPIAKHLGIPPSQVFANRMNWQYDDDTGMPTKLVGFDSKEPTAHNRGKPRAIAALRAAHPYQTVVMVGDGITDLEAVQETEGADLFVGYGGVVAREAVAKEAPWFVMSHLDLVKELKRYRVCMIGSGAWACTAVRLVADNCLAADPADMFVDTVKVWVYEEMVDGRPLTEIINTTHENVKYLPGVKLAENIVATPDIEEAVRDADVICLCAPHQFMHSICKGLTGKVKPGALAISLVKGMRVRNDGPQLIHQMVTRHLGVDCSVLMGPNLARDMASGRDRLSEATIGYNNREHAKLLKRLFEGPAFYVGLSADVVGVEMCGTLKNVVALAAGMVDGLSMGPNTKSAIMAQGLQEMRGISKALYPTVRDDTFFLACGVGDLVATCTGGRNRLVAEAWTQRWRPNGEGATFDTLEAELLGGQKLQGVLTSNEVQQVLASRGLEAAYPLFTTINRIVNGALPPQAVLNYRDAGASVRSDDANDGVNGVPAELHDLVN